MSTDRAYVSVDPATGVARPDDLGDGADGSGDNVLHDDGTWGPGGGGGGVTDHGALTGLGDDDHPQYTTAAELAAYAQPLDADLTAIAALATTAYGRSLLEAATAAALRTLAGLVLGTDVPAQGTFDDHNARHETGGADAIKLDDLAAPDDNTDLDVSTAKHGLVPKAPNDTTKFLRGDATWAVPPGGGISADLLPWRVEITPWVGPTVNVGFANFATISEDQVYDQGIYNGGGAINDEIGWDVVLSQGTWTVYVVYFRYTTHGIMSVRFDGVEKGTIDAYGSAAANQIGSVAGIAVAASAKIRVTLKMASKNASSSSYSLYLSHVVLVRTA